MGSSSKVSCDSLLEINGHCFLCLNGFRNRKGEDQGHPKAVIKVKVHSIQCLARYLKLDRRKKFGEGGDPHLVTKLEDGLLLVELCEECAHLNRTFAEVYKQLERVQLEVEVQLNMFHETLMEAEIHQTGRLREFTLNQATMGRDLRGKLETVKALRKEVIDKCSRKLSSVQPRVALDDLDLTNGHNHIDDQSDSEGELLIDVDESAIPDLNELSGDDEDQEEDPELSSFLEILECDADPEADGEGKEESNLVGRSLAQAATAIQDDYDVDVEVDDAQVPEQNGRMMMMVTRKVTPLIISPFQSVASSEEAEELQNYTVDQGTGRLQCNVCSKFFKNIGTFVPHYRGTHLKVRYECEVCHKQFRRHDNYTIHYRNFHMGLRFHCELCNEVFTRKTMLRKHVESVHLGVKGEDLYQETSGESHRQEPVAMDQFSGEDQDEKVKMEVEDEEEVHPNSITLWADDGEGEGQGEEEELSQDGFDSGLSVPVGRPCNGPPQLKMKPDCPQPHSSKMMPSLIPVNGRPASPTYDDPGWANIPPPISNRTRCILNPKTMRFKCSHCALEFGTKLDFNYHAERVHLELRYKCTRCNKDFSGHGAYRVHYRSFHLGVRHKCPVCFKTFSQNSHLKYHQRTSCVAIGVRVHTHYCRTCGKGFYEAKSLRVHVKRVHHKIKEHGCTLCGKAFYLKCQLIRHQDKDHGGVVVQFH